MKIAWIISIIFYLLSSINNRSTIKIDRSVKTRGTKFVQFQIELSIYI